MASNRIIRPRISSTRLLDDHRFRALLSDEDWGRLPLAVWRRFSKRLADGASVIYVGEVDEIGRRVPAVTGIGGGREEERRRV